MDKTECVVSRVRLALWQCSACKNVKIAGEQRQLIIQNYDIFSIIMWIRPLKWWWTKDWNVSMEGNGIEHGTRTTRLIHTLYSQYHWWSCHRFWTLVSMHTRLRHLGKTSGIQNIIWRGSSGKLGLDDWCLYITHRMFMIGTSQSCIIRTYQFTRWQLDTIRDPSARYCWLLYHWAYHFT